MGTLGKGDVSTPKPQTQRGREKTSVVWEHFSIKNNRACCNQCNKTYSYSGPKQSSTSHLRRHIDTGNCAANRAQANSLPSNLNGTMSQPSKKRQRVSNGAIDSTFSQKRCNNEIARMILLHDYPLEMVEHPGFINFVRTLQPEFETVSSGAIYDECMDIYSTEKTSLANLLSEIPGRVSLSLNMWYADETLGCAVLNGHFIDNDWTLQRRLLNVITIPYPNSDTAFNKAVLSCLSSWGLESKLFALTLDRSFASEEAIVNLRGLLSEKSSHSSHGQFFLMGSCYAHILTSLALVSINSLEETVQKVRNCVKYVKTSELSEERFMEIKLQLKNPSKKDLVLDNCTRWDSTYHMLSAASELKEVFACLDTFDHAPSIDEWRRLETLCDYLECFYEAATVLTAQKYPTADKFFTSVYGIQCKLFNATVIDDPFVNNFVKPLVEKFHIYWSDCSFVLAMAVVLDPRYKLSIVEQIFSKLYSSDQAKSFSTSVEHSVRRLYSQYDTQCLPSLSFDVGEIHEGDNEIEEVSFDVKFEEVSFDVGEIHDGVIDVEEVSFDDVKIEEAQEGLVFNSTFDDLELYISEEPSKHSSKSELDIYLEEYLHITDDQEDFQILDWWKMNQDRYPTLSKMAVDLLSMSLATVPRDSVFDTVTNKVDSYRSLLKPSAIEAFACAKDWLQSGMHPAIVKRDS